MLLFVTLYLILNLFCLLCFETFDTYLSFHSLCRISRNILNVSNYSAGMAVSGAILPFSHHRCTLSKLKWISPRVSTAVYLDLCSLTPSSISVSLSPLIFYLQPISWYVLLPLCIFPHFITVPLLPLWLDLSVLPSLNVWFFNEWNAIPSWCHRSSDTK